MKFLLIDDDETSLKKLKNILSAYGECHMVTDGDKALELFMKAHIQDSPYALVTIDADMPKSRGLAVLKQIRTSETEKALPPVKIIVIAEDKDKTGIDMYRAQGCSYYLLKPFDAEKIEDVISAILKIPLSEGIPLPSRAAEAVSPAVNASSFRRILIVDDEIVSLSKLKIILAKMGPCETATTGGEAVAKFIKAHEENNPFDLVTLDIDLPDLKGPEVLKEIRKWEAEHSDSSRIVSVLMVTAFSDKDNVIDSIRSGCTYYLTKPFDSKKIIEALSKLPGKTITPL